LRCTWYATGLRLSEVVAAKVDDLIWVEFAPDAEPLEGWMLRVVGKGQKAREVPVPLEVVTTLAAYLESRGLDPDPQYIGNRGIARRVERAAALLRSRNPPSLAEVARATGHASASHLVRRFRAVWCMTPGRYRAVAGRAA
jgi:site-specific recombinase XerC